MTRPQYAPVPRGYVRVWVVAVEGSSSVGGYQSEHAAQWTASHHRGATVTPLDIPAGAVPGLGTTKKARKR